MLVDILFLRASSSFVRGCALSEGYVFEHLHKKRFHQDKSRKMNVVRGLRLIDENPHRRMISNSKSTMTCTIDVGLPGYGQYLLQLCSQLNNHVQWDTRQGTLCSIYVAVLNLCSTKWLFPQPDSYISILWVHHNHDITVNP